MITVKPAPFYSVWKYKPLVERLTVAVDFSNLLCEATAKELIMGAPSEYVIQAYNPETGGHYPRIGKEKAMEGKLAHTFQRAFNPQTLQDGMNCSFHITLEIPKDHSAVLLDQKTGLVDFKKQAEQYEVAIEIENGWNYVWFYFAEYFLTNLPKQLIEKFGDDLSVTLNDGVTLEQAIYEIGTANPHDWLRVCFDNETRLNPAFASDLEKAEKKKSTPGQKIFGHGFQIALRTCQIKAACNCSWYQAIVKAGSSQEWTLSGAVEPKKYKTSFGTKKGQELSFLEIPEVQKALAKNPDAEILSTQPDREATTTGTTKKDYVYKTKDKNGNEVVIANSGDIYVDGLKIGDETIDIVPNSEMAEIMRYPCLHILRVLAGGTSPEKINPDGSYNLAKMLGQSVASTVWIHGNKGDADSNAIIQVWNKYADAHFDKLKSAQEKYVLNTYLPEVIPDDQKTLPASGPKDRRRKRMSKKDADDYYRKIGLTPNKAGVKPGTKRGPYKTSENNN
jgi:hypothetical protein